MTNWEKKVYVINFPKINIKYAINSRIFLLKIYAKHIKCMKHA